MRESSEPGILPGCRTAVWCLAASISIVSAGCQPAERKVLDVEAPGVDIELRESTETGRKRLEIDVQEEPE